MKKIFALLLLFGFLGFQACKDPEVIPAAPTVTSPAASSVQINKSVDVTFTVVALAGYKSSAVTATGGTAVIKSEPAANSVESGSVVVTFTAGASAGAGSILLTTTDNKDQTGSQTGVLTISLEAPPTITLSATTGSGVPGSTVKVTATVTAPNGFASIAVSGATSVPASPIAITAAAKDIEISIPATAVVGSIINAVFTTTDAKGLTSSGVTLAITVTDATIILTGTLTADYTIEKGKAYLVKGQYFVPAGKTLTVNKGAIVKGDKASKGAIVVQPGGILNAIGTAAEPIVFTSSQPVGERDRGDWAGILLLGDAYVNQASKPAIEGISPTVLYGTVDQGNATVGNNTQSSGTLKYVRIEYAGIELTPNNETNGLTMGGVGSGTVLDYIQSSYGGDDAFEWFGGTVSATHLISLSCWDDDFDTDFAWRGTVQWALSLRNPFYADQSGSTAFESDSQGNGNAIGTVCDGTNFGGCTQGVFSNVTVLGPRDFTTGFGGDNNTNSRAISGSFTRAMHLRRRTGISIFNSVITGWGAGTTALTGGYLQSLTLEDNTNNYKTLGVGVLANNVLLHGGTVADSQYGPVGATTPGVLAGSAADLKAIWEDPANANSTTKPTTAQSPAFSDATKVTTTTWGIAGTKVKKTISGTVEELVVPEIASPYEAFGIDRTLFFAGYTTASYPSNPNFALLSGGSLLNQTGLFTNSKLANGFTSVDYKGAFGTADWTDSWAEFQPLSKAY